MARRQPKFSSNGTSSTLGRPFSSKDELAASYLRDYDASIATSE